jgi:hypothetical protein
MKLSKLVAVGAVAMLVVLSTLVLAAPIVQAQSPPPDDPSEPWYPPPPEDGGGDSDDTPAVLSEGGQPPAPGARCEILSAFMQDQIGNAKTEFIGNELFYLNVTVKAVPGNNTTLCVAEYFPSGTLGSHWLYYHWPVASSGTWRFGPLYAQPLEPEGTHTLKIWLNDYTANHRDDYLVRFNYSSQKEEATPEESATPTDISTSISISLNPTSVKVNETVSVFATVNPANAGTVTVEQSEDGVIWIAISSGTATGTVTSQFTPTESGTYYIRARCNDYLDSAANKKYLASESSPVILEVATGVNWVIYIVVALAVIVVGVVIFWLAKRGAAKRT